MTTLREKYQYIAQQSKFKKVMMLIGNLGIEDVNQLDIKGRSLLFYMIDSSGCEVDVTLDFIKIYNPNLQIRDIYGQTIFFRITNTIRHQELFFKEDLAHLIDFILDMTPMMVLLRKDNACVTAVEYLFKELNEYKWKCGINDKSDDWNFNIAMYHRLKYPATQISQHINRKCTLFELMYCEYEDKINKKQRF